MKFYCYICKTKLYGVRQFKKHALKHFKGDRCPYCNMKVKKFLEHLVIYHIQNREQATLIRGLALLCKEAGNTDFLNDESLGIDRVTRFRIRKMVSKL